jgi:glycosyltransferase involved in cell wall biosynthesis
MRIALDATPLTVSTGGIRRYTIELARALRQELPPADVLLLGQPPSVRRWWSWGLPRELARRGVDVFHGTDFAVPYLPTTPAVMTVHDLSPWSAEGWNDASDRVRRRTPWLLRLGLARFVVTPTEAIRRETIARFRLKPNRVIAVPEAASSHFRPIPGPPPPKPYFLFVGTIGPRKNLTTIVEAWRPLRDRANLLVAGRGTIDTEPGLRLLGPVPDDDLPALYSNAGAFLFPSCYEGFGLPVLEAMQCGTPVIASRDPALVEVAGGAALHCNHDSPEQWRQAMEAALARRGDFSAAGTCRAAQFSWAKTAKAMLGIYAQCLRARPT